MNGPVNAVYYGDDAARPHDEPLEATPWQAVETRGNVGAADFEAALGEPGDAIVLHRSAHRFSE